MRGVAHMSSCISFVNIFKIDVSNLLNAPAYSQ